MFIKLTKKDGNPIWINSGFIVTMEPVRSGGTIVVPFGDGLDYEVREGAESIVSLIEGVPVAEIVPAVSTEEEPAPPPETSATTPSKAEEPATPTAEPAAPEAQPVFEPVEVPALASESESAAAVAAVMQLTPKPEPEKPTKRTRKAKTRPAPSGTPATEGERKIPRRRAVRKTPLQLTEEQLARVRTMAPRSVKRLSNALLTQFAVTDPETMVRALVEHDIITVDEQSHITWIK